MDFRNEYGSTGYLKDGVFVPYASQAEADGQGQNVNPAPAGGLPEQFPSRDLLTGTAFKTLDAVKAASDDELLAVEGIGPATLKAIRGFKE